MFYIKDKLSASAAGVFDFLLYTIKQWKCSVQMNVTAFIKVKKNKQFLKIIKIFFFHVPKTRSVGVGVERGACVHVCVCGGA